MAGSITYNTTRQNISVIYRATSGGTVFSANLAGSGNFDYFTDTAVVNDAIYFNYSTYYNFSDLYLNIGTTLTGTDVVLVWEYYCSVGSTFRPIHNLTDGSNGFTTTGQVRVRFPLQAMSGYTTASHINSHANYYWVRCRIVSLTAITEGGANTTDRVQCSDGCITITGYTDAAPCTWLVVHDWCVVNAPEIGATRIGQSMYKFDNCTMYIASTLRSTSEQIFTGNGCMLATTFRYNFLWSGTKVGTDGWMQQSDYFFCRRSGGGVATSVAETRIYGGKFAVFVNVVDGITCVTSGFLPMSFGEYIGVTMKSSGYFQTAISNKCVVDGRLICTSTPNPFPQNLTIANPGEVIFMLYYASLDIPGLVYALPTQTMFHWSTGGAEGITVNMYDPTPSIPTQQVTFPILLGRTLGGLANLLKCYFYDDSAGTYTDYTTASTNATVDDIPINGDVNDCLYMQINMTVNASGSGPVFSFTMSNQLNDYVYITELWNGSIWTTSRKEWNSTNNYTTTGKLWIANCQNWVAKTINGVSGIWARIRIVSKGIGLPTLSKIQVAAQTGIGDWHINEKFTCILKVVDVSGVPIQGVSVSIKDVYETEIILSTDVNGLTESTYLFNKQAYLDPLNIPDAQYNVAIKFFNPYTFILTKTGYETYTSSGITVDAKLNLTITMKPIVRIRQTLTGDLLLANQPELGSSAKMLKI